MNPKRVVIGLLGAKLDLASGRGDRWAVWRPTVSICQHEDLLVDRFELLFEGKSQKLLKQVVSDIQSVSPETEVRTHKVTFRDPWDFEEVYSALHQFALDSKFDPDNEQYLVHITTGTHVAQICLFLLTESRHLPGVLLQTAPPRRGDRGSKPGQYRLIDLDLSRYDALASRFQQEKRVGLSFLKSGIETRDQKYNALIERIERVSLSTPAPILLTGPTGAGKSQLAKRIHQLKRQRDQVQGELVEVNCATIRGEQSMSTLFGHVKGAFTGAVTPREGLLKAADGGVLFLDEISELGLDEQAMLLRAIEDKSFLPVGSDSVTESNFQLLAGTNRNLTQAVAQGQFREDLLARINLWSFQLPGLADRRSDIPPNLDFELEQFTAQSGRKVTMNREARKRFLEFAIDPSTPWNANFRDLNAAVVRMATLSSGGRITIAEVVDEIDRLRASWHSTRPSAHDELLKEVLNDAQFAKLDLFDQCQLAEVIRVCRRNRSAAAAGRELFHVSRQTRQTINDGDRLRKYLAKFGLAWKDIQHRAPK